MLTELEKNRLSAITMLKLENIRYAEILIDWIKELNNSENETFNSQLNKLTA